ncbi:unnamed protein product [Durusdinium trenchii]|uniref:Uncharacterized protein n=1 Tax=Durusdinium trenchii TaxID=1381693 RepID=A0ABP0SPN9_9DINO
MSSRIIACFLLPALGSDLSPGGSCRVRRARHVLRTAEGDQLLALREETDATGKWSGNKVWPGALALLGHVYEHYELKGLKVLELGCGLPFLSMALGSLGAEVCATDHPEVLDQVRTVATDGRMEGLSDRAKRHVRFEAFAWGEGPAPCAAQLVLGADLVYDGFPVDALFESTTQLLNHSGDGRARALAAVFALQPRQFPMTAALREPQLIAGFLRRFAQLGFQVAVTPVTDEALGVAEQPETCGGARSSQGCSGCGDHPSWSSKVAWCDGSYVGSLREVSRKTMKVKDFRFLLCVFLQYCIYIYMYCNH